MLLHDEPPRLCRVAVAGRWEDEWGVERICVGENVHDHSILYRRGRRPARHCRSRHRRCLVPAWPKRKRGRRSFNRSRANTIAATTATTATYVRAPFAEVDTRGSTWVAAPFARVSSGRRGTWVRAPFVNLCVPR